MAYSLEHFRNLEFNGVKDLADAAEQILQSVGPSQGKGTVTEYPNARTIRYYLAEGLLPQPIDKRGLKSIFIYRHLLILLAIKKLQSDGLPINVIKTLITYKDVNELESLLNEEEEEESAEDLFDSFRELQSQIVTSEETPLFSDTASFGAPDVVDPKNSAKSYLESLLFKRPKQSTESDLRSELSFSLSSVRAAASKPPDQSEPEPSKTSPQSWKRYTLVPGVEIHIERNYKPPKDDAERKRIIELIERIMHFRSRK